MDEIKKAIFEAFKDVPQEGAIGIHEAIVLDERQRRIEAEEKANPHLNSSYY